MYITRASSSLRALNELDWLSI